MLTYILTLSMPSPPSVYKEPCRREESNQFWRKRHKIQKGNSRTLRCCVGPEKVAVMHCKGHQKGDTLMAWGNYRANHVAKLAAAEEMANPTALTPSLFPSPLAEWDSKYFPQEEAWFKTEEGSLLSSGWWKFKDRRIAVPGTLAPDFVKPFHQRTHLGRTAP